MATALLKVGSKGPVVKLLQKALNTAAKLPKPLPENENFGPETKAAVEAFQKLASLKADGIVGPQTAGALAKRGGSSGTAFATAFGGDGAERKDNAPGNTNPPHGKQKVPGT
jgi:peptidoglycan hydrolase-like protein with peptidoglycan-binding domain